jgi:hypothetical protein
VAILTAAGAVVLADGDRPSRATGATAEGRAGHAGDGSAGGASGRATTTTTGATPGSSLPTDISTGSRRTPVPRGPERRGSDSPDAANSPAPPPATAPPATAAPAPSPAPALLQSHEMQVGQCLNDVHNHESFTSDVEPVPCTSPHHYQVVAIFPYPAGAYPGDARFVSEGDAA